MCSLWGLVECYGPCRNVGNVGLQRILLTPGLGFRVYGFGG